MSAPAARARVAAPCRRSWSRTGGSSDGSTFSNHNVDHFNQRPDGTVHEFFHCH